MLSVKPDGTGCWLLAEVTVFVAEGEAAGWAAFERYLKMDTNQRNTQVGISISVSKYAAGGSGKWRAMRHCAFDT